MTATSVRPYQITKARLLMLSADGSITQEFVLQETYTIMGRSPQANLVISSVDVSRFHTQIVRTQKGYFVTDMASTNGTYLNGIKLAPKQMFELRSNDQINLGRVTLLFQIVANSIPSIRETQRPQHYYLRQSQVNARESIVQTHTLESNSNPQYSQPSSHQQPSYNSSPQLIYASAIPSRPTHEANSSLPNLLTVEQSEDSSCGNSFVSEEYLPASVSPIECQKVSIEQVPDEIDGKLSLNSDCHKKAEAILKFELIPFHGTKELTPSSESARRFIATDTNHLNDFYYPRASEFYFEENEEYRAISDDAFHALSFSDKHDHLRGVFQRATSTPLLALKDFLQGLIINFKSKFQPNSDSLKDFKLSKHSFLAWLVFVFGLTTFIAFRNLGVFG
ncbi:MAG: FHA domain-containing protein [Candidatus Caenarcaniphilales bacterium]|nr:FHA domain-containing protein [Candidatus Caenarcaniphilales bacterium]